MAAEAESPVRRVEVRSGAELPAAAAFERWEAHMVETYFPLHVAPASDGDFHGWISHGRYGDLDLTALASAPQEVRRTARSVANTDDDYLLASICVTGRGRLHMADGRVDEIGPGEMMFFESGRELHWDMQGQWQKTVLQVPLARLREHGGLTLGDVPTAVKFPRRSAAAMVGGFFRDVAGLQSRAPEQAALLAEPALDLLVAAVAAAARSIAPDPAAHALDRLRVLAFMREHRHDPGLTVDRIAQGCMMSRRSLYRVFDEFEGGPAAVLRRMRVDHACRLLADTALPISAVAQASGFPSERQFYRTFRMVQGVTPAAFRTAVSTD
ncbi:AraC family transcriptional regulator [Nocardia crassostreae]|uniref:AraC family transcriptional regulator n=1 Tax=Nocardia crassostreae TaxID=53428 RepID=UPI000833CE0F|nr:AraC family transcriptional regulator [Nocardia crassostreae]